MMRDRQAGMSILELLIALALLAMIASILAGSISTGARVWERSKTLTAQDQRVVLRAELRRWIEAMKPPSRPTGLKQEALGTATRLQFLTSAFFAHHPPESEARVTLEVTGSADRTGQVLKVTLEALDTDGSIAAREDRILAGTLSEASLRYYRAAAEQRPGGWQDAWTSQRALPALISIAAGAGDGREWPVLTVRPDLQ